MEKKKIMHGVISNMQRMQNQCKEFPTLGTKILSA